MIGTVKQRARIPPAWPEPQGGGSDSLSRADSKSTQLVVVAGGAAPAIGSNRQLHYLRWKSLGADRPLSANERVFCRHCLHCRKCQLEPLLSSTKTSPPPPSPLPLPSDIFHFDRCGCRGSSGSAEAIISHPTQHQYPAVGPSCCAD